MARPSKKKLYVKLGKITSWGIKTLNIWYMGPTIDQYWYYTVAMEKWYTMNIINTKIKTTYHNSAKNHVSRQNHTSDKGFD